MIPKATRGQYDLIGSVRGYVHYLRDQATKAQAGAPDYAAERARFIRARADLAEMEAEQRRGALIAAEDVEAAWITVLALLRTRLLALPDRLAPVAHEQSSVADTRTLIRAALREVLHELAETHVAPDPDIEPDGDAEPPGDVEPASIADPAGDADPAADGDAGAGGAAPTTGTDDR